MPCRIKGGMGAVLNSSPYAFTGSATCACITSKPAITWAVYGCLTQIMHDSASQQVNWVHLELTAAEMCLSCAVWTAVQSTWAVWTSAVAVIV